ncbi:hypothetical protein D9M69_701400 [compost metagenome]
MCACIVQFDSDVMRKGIWRSPSAVRSRRSQRAKGKSAGDSCCGKYGVMNTE